MGLNVGSGNACNGGGTGIAIDGGVYSPAKLKASNRGAYYYNARWRHLLRRIRQFVSSAISVRIKLLASFCMLFAFLLFGGRAAPLIVWRYHAVTPLKGGYTVLINTWKRNSLLKQSVAHYASCIGMDAIHVVWSESDPPSESLKMYLREIVQAKSQTASKPNFRFNLNEEDNLNNRFKPIKDLRTEAIFSVDDDVIVPCETLDFAFTVWQGCSNSMVGFVPRMHWLDEERTDATQYTYKGWWTVWWMGTYSMVLSKAAFFHRKYLDLYTYTMPASVRDYVTQERNCEDIAMSLLVANATGAPPIWVRGKINEIGSSGISSLKGHNEARNKCLNDFIALYGAMPLVPTNVKVVDARAEWFW